MDKRCLYLSFHQFYWFLVTASSCSSADVAAVQLLQAYNGCIDKDLSNATVRAAVIKAALSEAPAPYGTHKQANTSVDGLFCECGNGLSSHRCSV